MVKIENGPAMGLSMLLHRAPHFLRLVVNQGEWDALDMPDDVPKPAEAVYAYKRIGDAGSVHLKIAKKRKATNASGWYAIAIYRYCEQQPTDAEMRDTAAWRAWCAAQPVEQLSTEEGSSNG